MLREDEKLLKTTKINLKEAGDGPFREPPDKREQANKLQYS